MLRDLRVQWDRGLTELVGILEREFLAEGVRVSSRVKNLGTLREKLQRLSGGLSSVRDIIGCRLVIDGSREVQAEVVQRLMEICEDNRPRVISRVTDPRAGYRAVHVEIRLDECRAEIQVRTRAQHEWANSMERFGDRVGRGVRYDDDSFAHLPSEIGGRARECLVALNEWSEAIDLWERSGSPPDGERLESMRAAEMRCKSLLEEFNESL